MLQILDPAIQLDVWDFAPEIAVKSTNLTCFQGGGGGDLTGWGKFSETRISTNTKYFFSHTSRKSVMVITGNYHHHHHYHWSPLDRRYRYRKPGKSHTFIQMFSMVSFQHAFLPFIFKQCLTCRSAYGVLLVLNYEPLCISRLDLILTTIQVFQPFLLDFCVLICLLFVLFLFLYFYIVM